MATIIVDSPRAWGTVVGGFIANFMLGGLGKSYGIIMEAFQDEFGAPTAIFTLTGGVIYMLMFILSLPNHFVVQRIGDRAVVMIGAISACISFFVASVAPSITVWAIAIGGGVGFSFSCVYFNIFSVVGRCFREKLGLANGLSVSGVSLGQMAFPSLVTFLLQRYGVRGGTLIMSAFSLHLCITAALMPRHVVDPAAENTEIAISSSSISRRVGEEEEEEEPSSSVIPSPLGDSSDDIEAKEIDAMLSQRVEGSLSYSQLAVKMVDEETLATTLLIIYVLGKVFADNGDVGISFIAPPYGTQMGFSAQATNLAIAIAGGVDLFSRLFFGWLTDKPFCKGRRGSFLATIWLVEATVAVVFGEISGVGWTSKATSTGRSRLGEPPTDVQRAGYYICFALQGVCSGTAMTQMIIVLSDWVGPERLAKSLAIMMLNLGLLYVPSQAIIGYLNDLTGSYAWSMRLCSLWLLIGGLVFHLEVPLRRFVRRRSNLRLQRAQQNANTSPMRSPWCQHLSSAEESTATPEGPLTSPTPSLPLHTSEVPLMAEKGLSDSIVPFICSPSDEEGVR